MLKMVQTTKTKLFRHHPGRKKKMFFSARVICGRCLCCEQLLQAFIWGSILGSPTWRLSINRTNDHLLMRKGLAVTETGSRCSVNGVRVDAAVRSRMTRKHSYALVGSLPDGPVTINHTDLQWLHLSQRVFQTLSTCEVAQLATTGLKRVFTTSRA